MKDNKMWIGGEWTDAVSGKTYEVINPATEEIIAEVPLGDERDVDKAVQAAKKALPEWKRKTQTERSRILNDVAGLLRARYEEFVDLDVLDHGTPINMARGMMRMPAEHFEYAAQVSRSLTDQIVPLNRDAFHYLQREPMGVCGVIVPWNGPLVMITTKISAALATGNTCVVKPPSIDSLTALKLAEILAETELPIGAVNIVTGPGGSVGRTISSHPDISMVSFTGSCEAGKDIMANAAGTMKRLSMELGGKNPFIVLDDADVAAAVAKAVECFHANSGMVCASPGRYYIHESIHAEFIEKFLEGAKQVVTGDPWSENTMMGPVVSAEHRDHIERCVKAGIDEGAELLLGGYRPTEPPLDKGYYVLPTAFKGVKKDMTIAREEIFGPVACFMEPFSTVDEVLALANDNTFGLSASVWTTNVSRGILIANEIEAGAVWVNDHMIIDSALPWGGFKESGYGKENGLMGLEEYTQVKWISYDLNMGRVD